MLVFLLSAHTNPASSSLLNASYLARQFFLLCTLLTLIPSPHLRFTETVAAINALRQHLCIFHPFPSLK
jgi:hypothetical protein